MTHAMGFHSTRRRPLCGKEPKTAWVPVPGLALAAVRVTGVLRVASGSRGVAWTQGMAWARLTPVKAGVICDLICGGFCDGPRESANEIVSEIRHPASFMRSTF